MTNWSSNVLFTQLKIEMNLKSKKEVIFLLDLQVAALDSDFLGDDDDMIVLANEKELFLRSKYHQYQ